VRRVRVVDEASASGAVVRAAARTGEPDRYLAALLAPAPARPSLLALAALAAEIARVPFATRREPRLAELRLQWWRQSLDGWERGERTGHPVADAVRAAVTRHQLPHARIEDVIEATAEQLNPRAFADDAALFANLERGQGALFALAGSVLGLPGEAVLERAYLDAGAAYGLARLLYELPRTLALGRVLVPLARLEAAGVSPESGPGVGGPGLEEVVRALAAAARARLRAARADTAALPRVQRVSFLPLALVESYLRAASRGGGERRERVALSPLARIGRIAAAHWLMRP
jgi:phytoene synthase